MNTSGSRSILGRCTPRIPRDPIGDRHGDWLIRGTKRRPSFRTFGDETAYCGAALQCHDQDGPPAGWQENFVSAHATSHP